LHAASASNRPVWEIGEKFSGFGESSACAIPITAVSLYGASTVKAQKERGDFRKQVVCHVLLDRKVPDRRAVREHFL
jgi:hypothetical protein